MARDRAGTGARGLAVWVRAAHRNGQLRLRLEDGRQVPLNESQLQEIGNLLSGGQYDRGYLLVDGGSLTFITISGAVLAVEEMERVAPPPAPTPAPAPAPAPPPSEPLAWVRAAHRNGQLRLRLEDGRQVPLNESQLQEIGNLLSGGQYDRGYLLVDGGSLTFITISGAVLAVEEMERVAPAPPEDSLAWARASNRNGQLRLQLEDGRKVPMNASQIREVSAMLAAEEYDGQYLQVWGGRISFVTIRGDALPVVEAD